MRVRLHRIEVHLDLVTNRYSGIEIEPPQIGFNEFPVTHRDASLETFDAICSTGHASNAALYPRFCIATTMGRIVGRRSIRDLAHSAQRCAYKMAQKPPAAPKVLARKIAAYQRLACYRLVPARCLPDSLVCLFFLSDLGCRANLVIGVKSDPFEAHAWLEINGQTVNDTIRSTSKFKPILQTATCGDVLSI